MRNSPKITLVLGGTGSTGSLVARKLAQRGLSARTASRHRADAPFDWDDPATQGPAPPASFADFAHRNAHAWAVRAAHS